jgi:hypothetical protein
MGWKFAGSCTEGERFEVLGANVWSCEWVRIRNETAPVRDPLYSQVREFAIYELSIGQNRVRVAAGEFSNGVWGFYLPVN